MKNYIRITALFLAIVFNSCEDVIDVPVQTEDSRLVIEASLDWEKGTQGNEQSIRLSRSSGFFDTNNPEDVTGASVSVTNDDNGAVFVFTDQNDGSYRTSSFIPILGQSYTLEIVHNGETYTAQETLMGVTDITDLYQDRVDGFDDETIEVHITFNDPPALGNYYFFKLKKQGDLLPTLELGDDEFINGNEVDWWYEILEDEETDAVEAFQPGDVALIEMYGISKAYGDYLNILINQIGGVGLFEALPVSIKGNCINQTNSENYAYGYFRLTQVVKTSYTIE